VCAACAWPVAHGPLGYALEYAIALVALHLAALRALLAGATVLHIHNPPDLFVGAGAMFRLARRKVIFDHHDLAPETIQAKFNRGALARAAALAERLTYAVASHVLVTNESYASLAMASGKSSRQITVVRNAPPAAWLRAPGKDDRDRERLSRVELVYLGAISSQDGVAGLAPVVAALRAEPYGLDAHLTVIGDGDARPALERALREHNVAPYTTITGWVALERVPELLDRADICVDPAPATYVNQRSTMMKVAEYLARARPVVAYDLVETRRTAGDAALLVTPGDVGAFCAAIATVACDGALRAELARAAARRAPALVWEHSERALLDAYERLHTA
jgi:glycosyltransferase involved in cell wall biosynthesis